MMTTRFKLVVATILVGAAASACCPLDCCLLFLPNPGVQQQPAMPLTNGQARAVAEHATEIVQDAAEIADVAQRY